MAKDFAFKPSTADMVQGSNLGSGEEHHTVILEKGQKGEKVFPAEPAKRARQRADSLADLHGAKISRSGNTIRVHASKYYDD